MKKILLVLFHFPVDLWQMFISYLPGPAGFVLRRRFWRKRLGYLGRDVKIDIGVYFQNPKNIRIGENCWIDRNVIILAGSSTLDRITYKKLNSDFKHEFGMVIIEENTHIAPNCILSGIAGLFIGKNCTVASNSCIYSFSHHYRNLDDRSDMFQYSFTSMARLDQQAMISSPVVIQDYCAVGLSSIVLPGVTLKRGTWIASGSVIKQSFEEQTLVYTDVIIKTKDLSSRTIRE